MGKLAAQDPVADFTANRTSGCAPLSVVFTDRTTGDPKYWNWKFGDNILSTVQNPVVTFSQPGTYTVSLVARNATGVDSAVKTSYITVFPNANVSFSASSNIACAPTSIQFTSNATVPGGTITSYLWEFGDGTTSELRNPRKTFESLGYYNVKLTVTTSNGCTATASRDRFIRIINGVTPNFDFSRSTSCNAPVNVQFDNQTVGPGDMTYRWNLGDGTTSNLKNPSKTYNNLGTYNIELIASSSFGCADTLRKNISFSTTNTSFTSPDNVCPDKNISFTNTGNPAPVTALWNFGDGTTSNEINPTKSYASPGTYTVTLTNNYGECVGTFSKTITVTNRPPVDFDAPDKFGCKAPHTVNFQDLTSNGASWAWEFGDGNTSTQQNPVHTYTSPGSYTVKLTVTTTDGCTNTITKTNFVRIEAPTNLSVRGLPDGGCVPYTIRPEAIITAIDGIAAYQWDFGVAGGSSNVANPSFTYTNPGTYNVSLIVTTNSGCKDTVSITNAVRVGTKPTVDFTVDRDSTCAGNAVRFTSNAVPSDSLIWKFGDGSTSTDINPLHQYQDTGYMTVVLVAYNNGCADSLTKRDYVFAAAPVARFRPVIDCTNKLRVSFINESITDPTHGVTRYDWDFGNGQTSTTENPTVTYASFGTYTVTLTATDDFCTHSRSIDLRLFDLRTDFNINKNPNCRGEDFRLSTVNMDPSLVSTYTWNIEGMAGFNGGAVVDTFITINGDYDVTLTTEDINGCITSKTINNLVRIVGAIADFEVVNNGGCTGANINIIDRSTPTGAVVKWEVDFGDGNNGQFTNDTITHQYANKGIYDVFIKTTDNLGCTDTVAKPAIVNITRPQVDFATEDTLSCPGAAIRFKDLSNGQSLTYTWDFGDGTTSNDQNPTHRYPKKDTTYSIKLTLTDVYGCQDSLVKPNYIKIVSPKPSFLAIDTASICPPLETKFQSLATDYDSLYWRFGDGNTSTLPNTSNFYGSFGRYTATLYTKGFGGCLDSATAVVNIYNPNTSVSFTYGPLDGCNNLNVNFNLTAPPNTKFYVLFGDGSVDSSQNTSFSHFYRTPNFYRPSLILVDSLDCRAGYSTNVEIKVRGVLPVFGLDKRQFCDSSTVFFTDYSIGNDVVVDRVWDFKDGTFSNANSPNHFFNVPGTYGVTQTVTTATGCVNSYSDTVRVYRTPEPVITSPDEICLGEPISFLGSTVVPDTVTRWQWNLGNNATPTTKNTSTRYTSAGTFIINLTASNRLGCSSDTTKQVIVWPLPTIDNPAEVIIPVGTGINLPVTYSNNVTTWNWTPNKNLSCIDCPNPFANPKFTTKYAVSVIDSNGCRIASEITVRVICEDKNYFVPNTFSPNNDGSNDWFYPRGTGLDRIESLRIFNRWGEMVFERRNFPANNPTLGWNGMYKGKPAEVDAYIYIMEVICENGQIVPIKGNVTLIR
ncbi:PKD domain-containing protein [Flavihumibacter rivuli]|uniref:PKD domain-containing protein n=1 Tax=Flavihumibacter rivuli TaxID=2838156 RepID=UPI002739F5D7|nr:PKD domain-containing protein [Flavihumibacter rivuli]